jgi:hypothetical protein
MRKILALVCLVGLALVWSRVPLVVARGANALPQTGRPVLSPHESTSATVDGASLSITYGRPSMRGRKIFGNLVPFERIWCPGADECTRLTSDHDLQFAGLRLKAGEHSLWIVPSEKKWTLTFNSDGRTFHTRRNTRLDVGTIEMAIQKLPAPVEQMTFRIEPNPSGSGGVLSMSWENTRVVAPFTVVR